MQNQSIKCKEYLCFFARIQTKNQTTYCKLLQCKIYEPKKYQKTLKFICKISLQNKSITILAIHIDPHKSYLSEHSLIYLGRSMSTLLKSILEKFQNFLEILVPSVRRWKLIAKAANVDVKIGAKNDECKIHGIV